ncbi:hypothetical protein EXIGLDRAFT_731804 [Exidia glandulosa HHB12029]|uniref:F-box domain-containing protein n=1 Tax=Exidia glandulosa HHB12029 TaxID=1314781 RepID=A0A165BQZ0_EXIGL|nr:hypothetical protein EXIGLDRAFT_731804 [Exidia glandulosa HHB12029]
MTSLNPNRYAGHAEAVLLCEDIAADEAAHPALIQRVTRAQTALHDAADTLRAAQEAFESAQRIHNHATQLELALVERVRVSRGLLHPIRRLPDELLVLIFLDVRRMDCIKDNRRVLSPAAVCQRWRSVALHTPQLWDVVNCAMFRVPDAVTEQRWTLYAQLHLERSATRPLSVSIQYNPRRPEPHTLELWPAFSALFRRARSFSFETTLDVTLPLSFCMAFHAPGLLELHIDDTESKACTTSILRIPFGFHAPKLDTLRHCGSELLWATNGVSPSVQKVELTTERFETRHLLDLFSRFPNVRALDVLVGYVLTSSVPVVVRAKQLQSLKLIIQHMDMHIAQSFHFPSLRRADITVEAASDWEPLIFSTFMHSALPTVTSLTLAMDLGEDVASGLSACVRVEHLTLRHDTSCCLAHEVEGVFSALSASDTNGSWIFPSLQKLTVDGCVPLASMADAIVALASARCASAPSGPRQRLMRMPLSKWHDRGSGRPAPVDAQALQQRLNRILSVEVL